MDWPATLLYTGTVPGEAGVGGIVLGDLYSLPIARSMPCFAAIGRRESAQRIAKLGTPVFGWSTRRYETAYRPLRNVAGELISRLANLAFFQRHARAVAKRAIDESKALQVQQVFAVLDSPTMIFTARKVASALGADLKVLVWDAPELLADQLQLDRWSRVAMLSEFENVIRAALVVAVPGESMAECYSKQFGSRTIVLRHGISDIQWNAPRSGLSNSDTIVVGFAGSITAPDAFNAMTAALDSCEWRIAGKNVILRLTGPRFVVEPTGPHRIEHFGYQKSVQETIDVLSSADVLYLPQPFSERLRPLAELSFPTKLSTYVAAGRPIFLHAPAYASVVPFFQNHPVGCWCGSDSADEILRQLEQLVLCQDVFSQACHAIEHLRQTELNARVFEERFLDFMRYDNKAPRKLS